MRLLLPHILQRARDLDQDWYLKQIFYVFLLHAMKQHFFLQPGWRQKDYESWNGRTTTTTSTSLFENSESTSTFFYGPRLLSTSVPERAPRMHVGLVAPN